MIDNGIAVITPSDNVICDCFDYLIRLDSNASISIRFTHANARDRRNSRELIESIYLMCSLLRFSAPLLDAMLAQAI